LLLSTFIIILDYQKKGKASPKHVKKTAPWLIRAVELTHNKYLKYNLGFYYEHGLGVVTDHEKAFALYSSSANKSYIPAVDRIGKFYLKTRESGNIDYDCYDNYAAEILKQASEGKHVKWARSLEEFEQHKRRICQELMTSTTIPRMEVHKSTPIVHDTMSNYNDDNAYQGTDNRHMFAMDESAHENNDDLFADTKGYSAADMISRKSAINRTVNTFALRNSLLFNTDGFTVDAVQTMMSSEEAICNEDLYNLLSTFLAIAHKLRNKHFLANTRATRTISWLMEAVELTHNKYLQYNLGFYYEHGLGVEADKEKAWALYFTASEKGYAIASERFKLLDECSSEGFGLVDYVKSPIVKAKVNKSTEDLDQQQQSKTCLYHPFAKTHWTEDCNNNKQRIRSRKRTASTMNDDKNK